MINILCRAIMNRQPQMLLSKLHPVLTYLYSDGFAAMSARSFP